MPTNWDATRADAEHDRRGGGWLGIALIVVVIPFLAGVAVAFWIFG